MSYSFHSLKILPFCRNARRVLEENLEQKLFSCKNVEKKYIAISNILNFLFV